MSRNFSSRSLGSKPRARAAIPRQGNSYFGFGDVSSAEMTVSFNRDLLKPVDLKLDPNLHAVRVQEKEEIKTLNNRFASFIDKVRALEQENQMLETKWRLLQTECRPESKLELMLKSYISSLRAQLEQVKTDRKHLEAELKNVHVQVEEQKQSYEDEINNRNKAENDFVLLKKDVDAAYMCKTALEDKIAAVLEDLNFFKSFYEQELRELQADLKDVSVVVQMDNSRELNLEKIVAGVKSQYEEISSGSRSEAEAWCKSKIVQISPQSEQCAAELKDHKRTVSDLRRQISRLQSEIASVKAQCEEAERRLREAELHGEEAVRDTQRQVVTLKQALLKAKRNMAQQLHDYQVLMNLKLALDIEIATYRKLLEEEENRLKQESTVSIHPLHNHL